MTHRSLSYNGLDEIDTRLQGPRSTPIQSQNRCTGRPGEPRTRIQMPSHPTSENLTPSATGTFHQTGFDDPIGQARGYDLCRPIDVDLQMEDPVIQNYIERNDAELKRIHAIVHMATSYAPDIEFHQEFNCSRGYSCYFIAIMCPLRLPR